MLILIVNYTTHSCTPSTAEDMILETESVKLIRFKQGLLKLSQCYVELGHKCQVIFESQTNVALQLPDVDHRNLRDIRYTG